VSSVALFVARTVALRLPTRVYRLLPDRVRWWAADVRVRAYVERGSW
jgi:hypothetical protein